MKIGDTLASLQQGVHRSLKSGEYKGNGEYTVWMDDGGNGPNFTMHFQLTSRGGGRYELRRIDCNDPPTALNDAGNNALLGGGYTLNFA